MKLPEMVPIAPGQFPFEGDMLGDRDADLCCNMTLTRGFMLSATPITQAVWMDVMSSEPWKTEDAYYNNHFEPDEGLPTSDLDGFVEGNSFPAVGVSWHDAVAFCEVLATNTGRRFRLPTAVEWQYCYRAGTQTAFYWGDPDPTGDASQDDAWAWHEENSEWELQEVAQKKPNPWGLYDMAGNVEEWVYDSALTEEGTPYLRVRAEIT